MRSLARIGRISLLFALMYAQGAHAQNVRTIFFVRHADKVSDDTDAPLSDAGHRRAKCLANTLSDSHIDEIFVSDLQRTQQTAAPLADKLHLKPTAIPLSTPDQLVEAIRASKASHVLVVWHDMTLPKIMQALGAPAITPIGHTEYDRFFILTLTDDKANPQPRFAALRYCNPSN
ncbi:MAG TPA: histidine phosphatase family protein [Candidatus Saccharimonadales bacterium]|jgi:phosphohistidine phosphatase SixA|nr:histidine phosphatase family protein [Candidatus Saccharimonadales bacterium]